MSPGGEGWPGVLTYLALYATARCRGTCVMSPGVKGGRVC